MINTVRFMKTIVTTGEISHSLSWRTIAIMKVKESIRIDTLSDSPDTSLSLFLVFSTQSKF